MPLVLACAVALAGACGPREVVPVARVRAACDGDVAWHRAAGARRTLDRWCDGVGPPVVSHVAVDGRVAGLLVISWNIKAGAGDVRAVVEAHRPAAEAFAGGPVGIVLLLQEAFGDGDRIPAVPPRGRVPGRIVGERRSPAIARLAGDLRMSLVYVPSMRNGSSTGPDREDRGSAILSTEPLSEPLAIELPFGRQRRVVAGATVMPRHERAAPLRVLSGHFDTGPEKVAQARFLRDWLRPRLEGPPILLGLDTNAAWGDIDQAVRAVRSALPIEPCGPGRTGKLSPLGIDFLFSTLPPLARTCTTAGAWHGSDHRPVVLTIRYDR